MGFSRLKSKDWADLTRLWAELGELPLGDTDQRMRHLFKGLCELTGASDTFLAFAGRSVPGSTGQDPANGWRLTGEPITYQRSVDKAAIARAWRAQNPAPYRDKHTQRHLCAAGRHRAFLRGDLVDDTEWRSCGSRDLLYQLEVEDRLVGAFALSDRVEIHFALDRFRHDRAFSPREREIVLAALGGLGDFSRRLARSYGVIDASRVLSPRERETLRLLLSGLPEKQIADGMGLTPQSLHQYVVALFRKFSVSSRVELMALWLNQKPKR